MGKKNREQSTVIKVHKIEKSMRRGEKRWARHRRPDTTTENV